MNSAGVPSHKPDKLPTVEGQSRNTRELSPSLRVGEALPAVSTLVVASTPSETSVDPIHLASRIPIAPQNADGPLNPAPHGEFFNRGDLVGRYEIIKTLGCGGMGAVYEANDPKLHRHVALKTLVGQLAGRPEAVRRFFLEAKAAGQLMHPNVVAILDFNAEGDVPFMAMELLQGEPLSAAIRRGPMPTKQVADALLGVCAGIESAHKAGIIHRDLKPSNIFLATDWDGQPRPRVLDFGISKIRDISSGGLTQTGDILGTSQYLSPEHAAGNRQVNAQSDIYSLGVVIYETVTQRTPQQGEQVYQLLRNVIEGRWQPPHLHRPDLPPAFESVILRAMQLSPADRFPSAFEMGRALFPFASSRVKRQFYEYYNGMGELSLPGSEVIKPANEPAKEIDFRAMRTEILPQSEVPDWQKMATHTALPLEAPAPTGALEENSSPSDWNASSSDILTPPSRRWVWGVGVGGLVVAIGMILLWLGHGKNLVEKTNATVEKAPLLANPTPQEIQPAEPEIPPPTASPALPLAEPSTSALPSNLRPSSTTKMGFTSRKKNKSTSLLKVKLPSPSIPSPAPPPEEQANTSSIAPTSNEGSGDPLKKNPDRW